MELKQYQHALHDYKIAFKTKKSRIIKKMLKDAELALKDSRIIDYYKILGVPRNASKARIIAEYRKKSLMYHPDKHPDATRDVLYWNQERQKEVNVANQILSDDKKREVYDMAIGANQELLQFKSDEGFHLFCAFYGTRQEKTLQDISFSFQVDYDDL
jgi:DnaJ-class molecular chaperone